MPNLGKIHVGDKNTDLQLVVQDTSVSDVNTAVDFSTDTASAYTIIVTDPDGTETELAASLLNSPGTDGIIHHVTTVTTLFAQAGPHTFKAKITFDDGGIFTSNPVTREVLGPE
jgi:hypothetical protein